MQLKVLINNSYVILFDSKENIHFEKLLLNERITDIEISILQDEEIIPKLLLDPLNGEKCINIQLQKHLLDNNKYILDKNTLKNYFETPGKEFKYIFSNSDSLTNNMPEGYVHFKILAGNSYFLIQLEFPFYLLTNEQYLILLKELQNHKVLIQFAPNSLIKLKYNKVADIREIETSGGLKLYLIRVLYSKIFQYFNKFYFYYTNLDEILDFEILKIDSFSYENIFFKYIVSNLLIIIQDLINDLNNEISDIEKHIAYKISMGVVSPEYLSYYKFNIDEKKLFIKELSRIQTSLIYLIETTIIRFTKLRNKSVKNIGAIINNNPYLKLIMDDYLSLHQSFQFTTLESDNLLPILSLPILYEHWTFLKIGECLESLGYKNINTSHEPLSFSKQIRPETKYIFEYIGYTSQKIRIEMIYNKYYETISEKNNILYGWPGNSKINSDDHLKTIRMKFGNKRTPDISLEIFTGEQKIPQILFFDATYSENNEFNKERIFPAKMYYSSTIFDIFGNNLGLGSWALHPQKEIMNEIDAEKYFTLNHGKNGALVLNPGDDKSFQILCKIIKTRFEEISIPFRN